MAVAIIALGFIILALLWLVRDERERHTRQHAQAEHEWAAERRELLERIQRPERPVTPAQQPPFLMPDLEPDEADLVGTITYLNEEETVA